MIGLEALTTGFICSGTDRFILTTHNGSIKCKQNKKGKQTLYRKRKQTLYQYINHIKNNIWYFERPLGKNSHGKFMAKAKEILGYSGTSRSKVANHSAWKISISTLLNNDIHPLHVSQLSGHKNTDSLKSYHTASLKQQEKMSNMLSPNDCGSSSTSSVAPIYQI